MLSENPVTSPSDYLIWTARMLVHISCILIKHDCYGYQIKVYFILFEQDIENF